MSETPLPSDSVQVLVVGAGPVGLFTALTAAQRGLDVRVIDQAWRGYAPGHAALLHGRTLELLQESGVAAGLCAKGRAISELALHVADAEPLSLQLSPPALVVPQCVVEEALLTALRALDVDIVAPVQATTIEQRTDGVHVRLMRRELVVQQPSAHHSEWEPVESSLLRAQFVVGADGYESRVRSALGIELVTMGATETFAMFEAPTPLDDAAMHLCFDDESCGVMLPMSGSRARWGFQVRDGLDEKSDAGRLRSLIERRASWYGASPQTVDWGTVIHFERRLARRFGKDRVWLAGDAAHVTSPLGSQSLNAGMLEGYQLAIKIAQAARIGAHQDVLEAYGAESAREWHKLLGINVGLSVMAHAPGWLSDHARRIVPTLPASGRALASLLLKVGLRMD